MVHVGWGMTRANVKHDSVEPKSQTATTIQRYQGIDATQRDGIATQTPNPNLTLKSHNLNPKRKPQPKHTKVLTQLYVTGL